MTYVYNVGACMDMSYRNFLLSVLGVFFIFFWDGSFFSEKAVAQSSSIGRTFSSPTRNDSKVHDHDMHQDNYIVKLHGFIDANFVPICVAGSVFAIIIGFVIEILIRRREFYRRNIAGVEEFESYKKYIGAKAIEGIYFLISKILIFGGGIILVINLVAYMMASSRNH